jgi:hypothetical protein
VNHDEWSELVDAVVQLQEGEAFVGRRFIVRL